MVDVSLQRVRVELAGRMQLADLVERQGNDSKPLCLRFLDLLLGHIPGRTRNWLEIRRSKHQRCETLARAGQLNALFCDRPPPRIVVAGLERETDRTIRPGPLHG